MFLLRLLMFLYCLPLPGWLLAQTFLPDQDLLERLALGACFGICFVPLVAFSLAMIFGINIGYLLLLSLGTAINAPLAANWLLKKRRK